MSIAEFVYPKNVLEKIGKLSRYDMISVVWVDASQCANVPIDGPLIDNRAVETQVISDGKYFGLQDGREMKETYLLLLKDVAGSQGTVQSIPLVLVREIYQFGKIQLMLRKSPFEDGSLVTRYPDGIVKRASMIFHPPITQED